MQVKDANRSRRLIAVLAVICFVGQLALAPHLRILDGQINFAIVFAGCVALAVGHRSGVISGFAAGLIFDLSSTGPVGLMAALLTASSFILGLEGNNRFIEDPRRATVYFAGSTGAVTLIYHVAILLMGDSKGFVDVMFRRWVPTAIMTFVVFLIFSFFLSKPRTTGGLGGSGNAPKHRRQSGTSLKIR